MDGHSFHSQLLSSDDDLAAFAGVDFSSNLSGSNIDVSSNGLESYDTSTRGELGTSLSVGESAHPGNLDYLIGFSSPTDSHLHSSHYPPDPLSPLSETHSPPPGLAYAMNAAHSGSTSYLTDEAGRSEEDYALMSEDKRRRNIEASARFRQKKREREREMARSTKEIADKVLKLEDRAQQLEMENRFLRGLILEKNDLKGKGGKGGRESSGKS